LNSATKQEDCAAVPALETSPTGIAPVLQVHPTRLCNIACSHCYTTSGPRRRERQALPVLLDCVQDAVALGYRQLAVSGGEPLLYTELAELLAGARALGMITSVTTNGMLASDRRWQPLAPLVDVLAISVDGSQERHDAIRSAGAFAATNSNLARIRSSGVPFGFIFTLTQFNADDLDFVVRLAAHHGARSVQVHPLTVHGRATKTMADARPDGIELAAALFEASRLGGELGVVVHVDAVTSGQIRAYHDRLVPSRPVVRLVDVAPVLIVESEGFVVPLTHEVDRRLALGSLADGRLAVLSEAWLACGQGERLADASERTWGELAADSSISAVYWYDEVAARTRSSGFGLRQTERERDDLPVAEIRQKKI
jgi:MoaA/NifB/PqqE/SkfB family radical SAM enzyme